MWRGAGGGAASGVANPKMDTGTAPALSLLQRARSSLSCFRVSLCFASVHAILHFQMEVQAAPGCTRCCQPGPGAAPLAGLQRTQPNQQAEKRTEALRVRGG